VADAARSATLIASASRAVSVTGGRVRSRSRLYPPLRPVSLRMATPGSRSASRSRSTVRTPTSNRRAGQVVLRGLANGPKFFHEGVQPFGAIHES
jgi:hypothetical protein